MERNVTVTERTAVLEPPGRTRLVYLDFLRCLAILLVIVLHVMTPYISDANLYGSRTWYLCLLQNEWNRTGVPLFFMISGYLLLRDPRSLNIAAFYRAKLPRLLIPLAAWNLVYCLFDAWMSGASMGLASYVSTLLNNGSAYHFWFVYTLLGLYLLTPFLKRIVDHATPGDLTVLLLLVLFPVAIRPLFNLTFPVYLHLFDPLVEGYAAYFLLGYLLGSLELPRWGRIGIYLAGAAGYALGTVGNLVSASAQSIPLPFNIGYYLNHFLCGGAVFVFFRTLFSRHAAEAARWQRPLATLSGAAFGVYWIHVLSLSFAQQLLEGLAPRLGLGALICAQTALTVVLSFGVSLPLSRLPGVRRLFS